MRRSCILLNHIVEKYVEISNDERKVIFSMINPNKHNLKDKRSFLYKIVNNKINGE